jgi:hypothetical protein
MSRVDFDFGTRRSAVPVEIYDENLVLVERRLSTDETALDPGAYLAVSRTPAGRAVQARFQVGKDAPTTVSLGLVTDAEQAFLELVAPRRLSWPIASLVRRAREPRLRGFTLGDQEQWVAGPRLPLRADMTAFQERLRGPQVAIALEQRGARTQFVRLPPAALEYVTLAVQRRPAAPAELSVDLRHPEASMLLSYAGAGQAGSASVLATSTTLSPEQLLRAKRADPLAAAAGAFVLLQLGELEALHDWTVNLRDWFPWLPDGLVANAELQARRGHHDEAIMDLLNVKNRGIPCLSLGLGVVTDRLRFYARRDPENEELQSDLAALTRYAVAADFGKPMTTFTGQAPDQPGGQPPSRTLLDRFLPDVSDRPDGSSSFRFPLPRAGRRRPDPITPTRRSSTMATATAASEGIPAQPGVTQKETGAEDEGPLTVIRVSFAVVLTAVFLIAAYLLYRKVGTDNSQEWERLVYIFGAIEALAFTAVGWVFGREVNRQRAETAEKRADDAESQKDAEKEKGTKLAGLVVGERTSDARRSALQPQGTGGAAPADRDSAAVEYARRHYGF